MAIDLTGRPIFITGASSGIGRVTAIACARAGMPVFVTARRRDLLDALAAEITTGGGRAVAHDLDVRDPGACAHAIEACVGAFGSVYAVFANAGYGIEAPVHKMNDQEIREMFDTNLFGSLNVIRPALPRMIEARSGHILMCSSALSRMSIPFFSVYSATKAAQNHLCRAMNLELAEFRIRASSVHPVSTDTNFFAACRRLSGGPDYKLVRHAPELFTQKPEKVVRKIVKCLRRPTPEVWTSQAVRFGMTFAEAAPWLTDLFLMRMVRERRRNDACTPTSSP